eukprot:scaffold25788_cov143-Isochrysis_galbana.AAC.5
MTRSDGPAAARAWRRERCGGSALNRMRRGVAMKGQWERMVRSIQRVSFGWSEASRLRRRAK